MLYTLRFFSLQNAVCFIILTYLVPVLFTFYIQCVLKLKKNNSGAKRLIYTFGVYINSLTSTLKWGQHVLPKRLSDSTTLHAVET